MTPSKPSGKSKPTALSNTALGAAGVLFFGAPRDLPISCSAILSLLPAAARKYLALQLFYEPLVRRTLRELYQQSLTISTSPTAKMRCEDPWSHQYSVCRVSSSRRRCRIPSFPDATHRLMAKRRTRGGGKREGISHCAQQAPLAVRTGMDMASEHARTRADLALLGVMWVLRRDCCQSSDCCVG